MTYYKYLRNHLEIILFLVFAQLIQVTDNISYSVTTCDTLQAQQMLVGNISDSRHLVLIKEMNLLGLMKIVSISSVFSTSSAV